MSSNHRGDGDGTRIEFQRRALFYGIWSSCINCGHWLENGEGMGEPRCGKFNALPPPEVIVLGCIAWLPRVPF